MTAIENLRKALALLTGRLAIAEAALVCARTLHMRTESYADHKVCNGIAGEAQSNPLHLCTKPLAVRTLTI